MKRFFFTGLLGLLCPLVVAQTPGRLRVAGAMKNVMQKGDLTNHIFTDTIVPRKGLYGLGPGEGLRGEMLILDGTVYKSTIVPPSAIQVKAGIPARSPFFVYTHIKAWKEQTIPENVRNLKDLEKFLGDLLTASKRPFAFRVTGVPTLLKFHIVNLPPSTKISSPADAHRGQQNFKQENQAVEILGFYSQQHTGIFNHHDSFMHMHAITRDRKKLGHVDDISFEPKQLKLFIDGGED